MDWPATTRYGLEPAPGGLAVVQDLINTLAAGRPRQADLLAGLPTAQAWLDDALTAWAESRSLASGPVVLKEADLASLRHLRASLIDDIRPGSAGAAGDLGLLAAPATATLSLTADGQVRARPAGTGWRHVASLLLLEMYDAQASATWRRLKTCANPRCSAAFYDRSRNNSRVWHDLAVCGNPANLQAHRARKRAREGGA